MVLGENWSQASKQMFVITDVKFLYYMVYMVLTIA